MDLDLPITNQPDNAKIKITGAFSNADQNVISLMLVNTINPRAITKGVLRRY